MLSLNFRLKSLAIAFLLLTTFATAQDASAIIQQAKSDPAFANTMQQQVQRDPSLLNNLTPAQRAEVERMSAAKSSNTSNDSRAAYQKEQTGLDSKESTKQDFSNDSLNKNDSLPNSESSDAKATKKTNPSSGIYGHDVFIGSKADISYRETPDAYVIAPGDEVYIRFWGRYNDDKKYIVSDKGVIFIEMFKRELFVAGKSFGELKSMITGLAQDIPGVDGEANVVSTRPIQVHFAGHCKNMGAQRVPAHFTFWQALMASGGPSDRGSVRDIRLVRGGTTIVTLDIYAYLQNGKRPQIVLKENDVLYFGSKEKVVTVSDFVRNPGVYELRASETLGSLVAFAGGVRTGDFLPQANIERFIPVSKRIAGGPTRENREVSLEGNRWESTTLSDGDRISGRDASPFIENEIYVEGNGVMVPGKYALNSGTATVEKALAKAGGLYEGAQLTGELIRVNNLGKTTSIPLNLGDSKMIKSFVLKPLDRLMVYHKKDTLSLLSISSEGYFRNPTTIEGTDSVSLYSLIQRSNGLKEGALQYVNIIHTDEFQRVSYTRQDISDMESLKQVILKNRDKVFAYGYSAFNVSMPVLVLAYGADPLTIPYSEDLDLDKIIYRLDGLNPLVDSSQVEFVYPDNEDIIKLSTTEKLSITEALNNPTLVRPGTIIIIRNDPRKSAPEYVTVWGEVVTPGRYPLDSKIDNLSNILKKAKGLSSRANPYSLSIIRGTDTIPAAVKVRRSGKLVFNTDWILNNGDIIQVFRDDNSVTVRGAVFDERPVAAYNPAYNWKDYVKRAGGGFLDTAQVRNTYVVYPNGIAQKARGTKIVSGSKVIVPFKPYKEPVVREPFRWKDFAPALASMASVLATTLTMILVIQKN